MSQDQTRAEQTTVQDTGIVLTHLWISPKSTTLGLTGIVLLLAIAGLVAGSLTGDTNRPFLQATFRRLFDLNGEGNVTAWFSASLLLLCSLLLALIAVQARQTGARYHRHWAMLALLFLFLSVDEAARLHEPISTALRTRLGTRGALVHAWVIPYGMLALAVAASYARFLLHLPPGTRALFLVAGGLYVGGALGMEMVAGILAGVRGWGTEGNLRYAVPVEELCEMIGVVVFIHALLSHLGMRTGEVRSGITAP